jgi:hypothetical protein
LPGRGGFATAGGGDDGSSFCAVRTGGGSYGNGRDGGGSLATCGGGLDGPLDVPVWT